MFGFRSKFGADDGAAAAAAATASCSFVPKRLPGHQNECAEVGIYKRKQESKKERKHAFNQESDREKKR